MLRVRWATVWDAGRVRVWAGAGRCWLLRRYNPTIWGKGYMLTQQFTNGGLASGIYELPFGKGRKYGSAWNRGSDAVAGGWEVTGINTANTGEPVNVVFYSPTSDIDNTGRISDFRGATSMRPNLIGDPTGPGAAAGLDRTPGRTNAGVKNSGAVLPSAVKAGV